MQCAVDHSRSRAPESRAARASVAPAARHRFRWHYTVEKLGVSQCLRRGNFLPLTARSRRDLQLSQAHTAPSVWITGIRDSKNIIRKAFRKVDLCGSPQFVRDNCIQVRAASGYITVLLYLSHKGTGCGFFFCFLRRLTPWTFFKSHIGLIRLKCQHQHEDTHVRWVLSRITMTALIFRVVSKDLL